MAINHGIAHLRGFCSSFFFIPLIGNKYEVIPPFQLLFFYYPGQISSVGRYNALAFLVHTYSLEFRNTGFSL